MNQALAHREQNGATTMPTPQIEPPPTLTLCKPTDLDVLTSCTLARQYGRHPGNLRFTQLINDTLPMYSEATSKFEKSMVIKSMVETVREYGGRFLIHRIPEGGRHTGSRDKAAGLGDIQGKQWIELSQREATDKISHALRMAKKKIMKAKEKELKKGKTGKELKTMWPGAKVKKSGVHAPSSQKTKCAHVAGVPSSRQGNCARGVQAASSQETKCSPGVQALSARETNGSDIHARSSQETNSSSNGQAPSAQATNYSATEGRALHYAEAILVAMKNGGKLPTIPKENVDERYSPCAVKSAEDPRRIPAHVLLGLF